MAVHTRKARGTRSLGRKTRPRHFNHVAGPKRGCPTCGETLVTAEGLACPCRRNP